MTRTTLIQSLRRQLIEERRKAVEAAAAVTGMLPPTSLLAHLADLGGAALAVEAVLDERAKCAATVME